MDSFSDVRPGWYEDPEDLFRMRFWDGRQWTDQTAPKSQSSNPGPPANPPIGSMPAPPPNTAPVSVTPPPRSAPAAAPDVRISTPIPTPLPAPPPAIPAMPQQRKGGILGGKKALEREVEELRSVVASIGIPERDHLQQEVLRLQQEAQGLQAHIHAEATRLWNETQANLQAFTASVEGQKAAVASEKKRLEDELNELNKLVVETREQVILQEVGIYDYAHPLDTSVEYKEQLDKLKADIKQKSKPGQGITAGFGVDGERIHRRGREDGERLFHTDAPRLQRRG